MRGLDGTEVGCGRTGPSVGLAADRACLCEYSTCLAAGMTWMWSGLRCRSLLRAPGTVPAGAAPPSTAVRVAALGNAARAFVLGLASPIRPQLRLIHPGGAGTDYLRVIAEHRRLSIHTSFGVIDPPVAWLAELRGWPLINMCTYGRLLTPAPLVVRGAGAAPRSGFPIPLSIRTCGSPAYGLPMIFWTWLRSLRVADGAT